MATPEARQLGWIITIALGLAALAFVLLIVLPAMGEGRLTVLRYAMSMLIWRTLWKIPTERSNYSKISPVDRSNSYPS